MKISYLWLVAGWLVLFCVGCTEKYPVDVGDSGPLLGQGGCIACHTDQDLLKQVADPLEPPANGDSGEG